MSRGGAPAGYDEFLGAWLENEYGRRALQLGCTLLQHPDDLLMTEVHPVVVTHGDNIASPSRATVTRAMVAADKIV